MLGLDEAKQEALRELVEKYKQGNKKALSDIFSLLRLDIFELLEQGVSIRLTKKVLEKATELTIKDDTFYKWVARNRNKDMPLNALKSPAIAKKEVEQGLTPLQGKKSLTGQNKSDFKQKGSVEPKEINTSKPKNPIEVLNSEIHLTDDKYKDLL